MAPWGLPPQRKYKRNLLPISHEASGRPEQKTMVGSPTCGPSGPAPPAARALPPAPAQPPARGVSSTPAWALLLPTGGCGVLRPHTHHLFCSARPPLPGATGLPARSSRHVCQSLSIRCAGWRAGVEDGSTGQDTVGSRKTLPLPQQGGCGAAPSPCLHCAGVSLHLRAVYPLAGGLSPAAARGCAVRAHSCARVHTCVRPRQHHCRQGCPPLALPALCPPPAQPPPLQVWGEQGSTRPGRSGKSGLTLALGSTSPEKPRAGTLSSNCP